MWQEGGAEAERWEAEKAGLVVAAAVAPFPVHQLEVRASHSIS